MEKTQAQYTKKDNVADSCCNGGADNFIGHFAPVKKIMYENKT
jgi:hypothetical protein